MAESFKFDTCCDVLGADSVVFAVPRGRGRPGVGVPSEYCFIYIRGVQGGVAYALVDV